MEFDVLLRNNSEFVAKEKLFVSQTSQQFELMLHSVVIYSLVAQLHIGPCVFNGCKS